MRLALLAALTLLALAAHQMWRGEEAKMEKKLKVDSGCALSVTAYTGYIDDPREQWKRADVLSAGPVRRRMASSSWTSVFATIAGSARAGPTNSWPR